MWCKTAPWWSDVSWTSQTPVKVHRRKLRCVLSDVVQDCAMMIWREWLRDVSGSVTCVAQFFDHAFIRYPLGASYRQLWHTTHTQTHHHHHHHFGHACYRLHTLHAYLRPYSIVVNIGAKGERLPLNTWPTLGVKFCFKKCARMHRNRLCYIHTKNRRFSFRSDFPSKMWGSLRRQQPGPLWWEGVTPSAAPLPSTRYSYSLSQCLLYVNTLVFARHSQTWR